MSRKKSRKNNKVARKPYVRNSKDGVLRRNHRGDFSPRENLGHFFQQWAGYGLIGAVAIVTGLTIGAWGSSNLSPAFVSPDDMHNPTRQSFWRQAVAESRARISRQHHDHKPAVAAASMASKAVVARLDEGQEVAYEEKSAALSADIPVPVPVSRPPKVAEIAPKLAFNTAPKADVKAAPVQVAYAPDLEVSAKHIATDDGIPPWQRYAVPVEAVYGKPMIAIIIDDVGIDKRRSAEAIALPGPINISLLPYATHVREQADEARKAGHELMVHVPMEPSDLSIDPGPKALLTGMGAQELLSRMRWDLSQFSGYVGINNHMGSRFTASRPDMKVVLDELKRRGLLYLDSRTSGKSVGFKMAGELGMPHASRNIFLDHQETADFVHNQLKKTEKIAKEHGAAIAIGHPKDVTLKALEKWLPYAQSHGFQIVPVSKIIMDNSNLNSDS